MTSSSKSKPNNGMIAVFYSINRSFFNKILFLFYLSANYCLWQETLSYRSERHNKNAGVYLTSKTGRKIWKTAGHIEPLTVDANSRRTCKMTAIGSYFPI